MINFDIHKIKLSRGLQISMIVVGCILPPLSFIADFAPKYLLKLDLIRLILLCITYGSAGILANSIMVMVWLGIKDRINYRVDTEFILNSFSIASFINFMVFMFPSLIIFVSLRKPFNLRTGLEALSICYIGMFAGAILSGFMIGFKGLNKKNIKNNKSETKDDNN